MLVPATEAMAEVKLAHDMTAFREAAAEAVAEVEVALMHGVIAIAVTHAVAEVQLAQEVPTFRVAMAEIEPTMLHPKPLLVRGHVRELKLKIPKQDAGDCYFANGNATECPTHRGLFQKTHVEIREFVVIRTDSK